MNDEQLPDDYFGDHLGKIESAVHGSANRVRHAMNQALIAIALRSRALQRGAVATAKRIGRSRSTMAKRRARRRDAVAYIERCVQARKAKKGSARS